MIRRLLARITRSRWAHGGQLPQQQETETRTVTVPVVLGGERECPTCGYNTLRHVYAYIHDRPDRACLVADVCTRCTDEETA